MPAPRSAELEVLFRICAAAHRAYRRANGSPHRAEVVGMGADGSPTEELDRAAETQILDSVRREGFSWNVISEEIGLLDRGSPKTLVVDPIDGTHNALRRIPSATISLALGTRDLAGIDIGVVHDLMTGVTFWAERGHGAFRDGQPIRTRRWEARSEVLFLNLGRHATPRVVSWVPRSRRVRALGCASLEMSLVAQGSGDAYLFENTPEERNLRVTDIAAAYRILLEAGGGVADARFQPIEDFPLSLDQHTSVVAWGDAHWLEEARETGTP